LAQNIVAAWLCGARFIELKTIQTLDELEVSKPCIDMQDEGYNCEWSQELKIEQSFEQYLDAIDNLDIGIFVVDDDYRIRYMNKTMVKWFGNHIGQICYKDVAGIDEPCLYCKLAEVINEQKKVIYEPVTPDGQSFEIYATSIKNSDGTYSKLELIRNVTEQKRAYKELAKKEAELDYSAHYDLLTELPNRVLFQDRFELAIKKSYRQKDIIALILLDLDNFKQINDSFGHHKGDMVLKEIAKRLQKIVRKGDTISRLSGDEFALIAEELKQPQAASVMAKKILDAFEEPIMIDNNEIYITCSIGISIYPNDGNNAIDLLKFADSAMHKAKSEGKNNFQFYSSELTEIAFERVVMEASFRASLKAEEFEVYYQPQVDATTNRVVGMEALVRWRHPSLGIVPPSKFIPLAESTGLIVDLDRLVMKRAAQDVVGWYSEGLNPGVLALNLAVRQLYQDDFLRYIDWVFDAIGLKPEWLELEVTEGHIMKNPEVCIRTLKELDKKGIDIAVDDFGTGYSSLSYLKKLPIDKLKIDQSFVRDLPQDSDDIAIVKAIIAMAKSLKLDIIAEGVETKEQKDFLLGAGCNKIQGYYYSRPVEAKEFREYLIEANGFEK